MQLAPIRLGITILSKFICGEGSYCFYVKSTSSARNIRIYELFDLGCGRILHEETNKSITVVGIVFYFVRLMRKLDARERIEFPWLPK